MPLDNSSIVAAHRKFVVQHPAIFPISPPHSRRTLKALSRGNRLPPLLYKGFDIFRMNKGSPFPSQQLLQRLPYEVEPPLIEEIKVAIRSGGVDQRRGRVDNLTKAQALIVDGTELVGSHAAYGTTTRSLRDCFYRWRWRSYASKRFG